MMHLVLFVCIVYDLKTSNHDNSMNQTKTENVIIRKDMSCICVPLRKIIRFLSNPVLQ